MFDSKLIYKASGKVLLAGGYGVLEQGNYGLSLAVNHHYYSVTSFKEKQDNQVSKNINVIVQSSQINGKWHYLYDQSQGSIVENKKQHNPFLQNAVKYSLRYALPKTAKKIQTIIISILFDRGFLSETQVQEQCKDRFIVYEGKPSKTGLGSSACVAVVVVGGIIKQLLDDFTEDQVNCLSQVANIAAQNKIGSNFDISTAVYGSQLYKNILPRKAFQAVQKGSLEQILNINPEIKRLQPHALIQKLGRSWLLDLKIGSDTRTMVSGFTKALHSQDHDTVVQFYQNNKLYVTQLYRLFCSDLQPKDLIGSFKAVNQDYRKFIQKYSRSLNIPVEPPQFQMLLDQISKLQKIIYCLCPGAGGYDAIVVLGIPENVHQTSQIQALIDAICKKNGVSCRIKKVEFEWLPKSLNEAERKDILEFLKP